MRNAVILAVLVSVVCAVACPPQVLAQIGATMEDAIQGDQDGDNQADPGDILRYTITITHTGEPEDPAATNLQVTVPLHPNTTLVPGGLRSTPVGVVDSYDTVINVDLTVTVDNPTTDGVLANDINLDEDPLAVVEAETPQTTTLGGTVVFTAEGGFTYTPPPGATGVDMFTYTVTDPDGNDPTPTTVTVRLNVNVAPSFVAGPDQTVHEDDDQQTVRAWATALSTGPPHEAGQMLRTFLINTDNEALFTVLPAISINGTTGDLTYTPAPDANGTATVTVRLRDNGGTAGGGENTSAPQTFTITVTAVNDVPAFSAGPAQTVLEDAGVQMVPGWATGITAGPANEAEQTLTFRINTDAAALFTVLPAIDPETGDLTYTLAPDVHGAIAVAIRLRDDGGTADGGVDTSAPQQLTLTVTAVNDIPVATADAYTVAEGASLTIDSTTGVLANDRDAEDDVLSAVLVNGPTHGTLTLNADGSFTYIHDGSEVLSDTFTYQASDESGTSAVTLVALTITPSNDAPVANADAYSVNAGATLTVDSRTGVLANDSDEEREVLTAVLVSDTRNGQLTLNADGSFTYTHDGSNTTSDSFTYQVSDGRSDSPVVTVTLTVLPRGDTPIAANDAYSIPEGDTLTVRPVDGVLANDSDPQGDPLTAVLVSGPTNGTLTLRTNGALTYVHDGSETTSDQFTYQASDGVANSPVATVTLTITPVNDAPSAVADAYSVAPGATLTVGPALGVLDNDSDAESAVLTAILVSDPAHGTLTLNTDGSFTYIHDGSSASSDTFTYQASDGSARSAVTTVTITITANTAPVAVADTYDMAEGETLTVATATGVLANDTDAEDDALTAVLITGPMHGILTLNADGSFTYIHSGHEALSDRFTYQASDGSSTSNLATVTLTITPVNDSPVAMADVYSLAEGTTLTVTSATGVLANDSDAEGEALTAVLVSGPTHGTLALNADGSFTYTHDGGETTSDSFTYQADDSTNLSAVATVSLTITPENDTPVALNDAYSVPPGGTLTMDATTGVLANDTDAEDDELTAVLGAGPTHGTLTLNADGSFTYRHDGSSTTSDRFTYRARDGAATSPLATVTISIRVNTAPVAVADAYDVVAGGPTTVERARGVLANDTDADGDPLTALLVSGPTHGGLTLNANGSFTYTHDGSNTTSDQFTYQARDGFAHSSVATVMLTITSGNHPPVARNDTYSLTEGTTRTIARASGVLANDTDPDGDPLTAVLGSGPAHGTLTLNANGSFTYTHDGSATISDRFTYRARDGATTSSVATVTLTITPVNDAPVAHGDVYNVPPEGTLTVDRDSGVLANDTDEEGTPLTAVLVTRPTHGTLTLRANGAFTYTHDGSNTTSDQFTYRARDGTANSLVATVTLTLITGNAPPVAVADTYRLTEGATLTITAEGGVLANDTDPERDPLTAVLVTEPTQGTLTFNADGSFVYTHDGSENPNESFTYQASDGISTSPVATVTLTITAVNDAPVARADTYSVLPGDTLTVDRASGVLANDSDPDDTALVAVLGSGPTHGTLTLNPNGSFTYTHDGSSASSDSFTYQASDGEAASPFATVTLNIGANTAPVAVADAYSVAEGGTTTVGPARGVLANDTDADDDPLTALLVVGSLHGTLTLDPNGGFTYTHDGSNTTSDSFSYQANDGLANSNTATVTLTIATGNDTPMAVADAYSLTEGETLTTAPANGVLANDTDADDDPLTAEVVSGPTHGTLTLNPDGSFTYIHDGSETISDGFTYQASDGLATSPVATVTFTIMPRNDAPVAGDDAYSVNAGDTLTVDGATGVLSNDTDAEGDALTAVLVTTPTHGTLTLNADGSFTYVHDGSSASSDTFTYQANDGTLDSAPATVTITILPGGGVPVAANDAYSVNEGDTLTVTSADGVLDNDSDPQGDPLSAVLVTGPAHGTLTLDSDGSFTYIHDGSETTTDGFTYQASDGAANSPVATVTITITPVNDDPVAGADGYGVLPRGTLTVDAASGVLANDTDADGDPLTAVLVATVTHGTLTLNANGSFTYTHDGSGAPSDRFTYRASDGVARSAVTTVTITIGANTIPVAMADAYSLAEAATLTVDAASGVLANDTDAENDPLTAVLVADPTHGTLTFNTDGSFTYTHDGSETTSDSFTYQANDGLANSTIATVMLTLTPVNDAPVAAADAYGVTRRGLLTVDATTGVLANDTDAELDPLTAVLVAGPTHGTLTLNADGGFTYTHDGSRVPDDSFTYRADDGATSSAVTTVTITVILSNTAPVAVADTYTVTEGSTLTINVAAGVLANDTDAEDDTLTAVLVTGPAQGTLTLNADGSFTYTHNGSETTSDSFTYQANDGLADSPVATVTFTVDPVNEVPVALADAYSVAEGGTLTIASAAGVLANDTDPDGDTLTAVLVTGPTQGTLTLNADGSFTYTHNGSETTSDSFTYQARDGQATSAVTTVALTITPSNDAPVAVADTYSVDEGAILTVSPAAGVLNNDSDVENDPLTAVLVTGPTRGALTLNANGSFTYTHDGSETASDSFTYQASDGSTASIVATVTLTVTAVNDAPVLTAGAQLIYTEDQAPAAIDTTITVRDIDTATLAQVTVQITGNYQAPEDRLGFVAQFGITDTFDSATGTLTLTGPAALADFETALRTVTYRNTSDTPDPAPRTITWIADDGAAVNNQSAPVTSTVTVTPVNDAPVLTAGSTLAYTENDTPTAIDPTITVNDLDTLTLASVTVQITGNHQPDEDRLDFTDQLGITGTFVVATGTLTLTGPASLADFATALRTVTYRNLSSAPDTGTRTITWIADDGTAVNNQSTPVTSTVTITAVNDAPVLTAGATLAYTEDDAATAIDATITVNDLDTLTLASVTVQITGNYQASEDRLVFTDQLGISGTFVGATGTLTLTGPAALADFETALRTVTYRNTSDTPDPALRTITWIADDGAAVNNQSAPVTSTVTITAVNDAPVLAAGATLAYTENDAATAIDATITVNDVDTTTLANVTVQITGNHQPGEDRLVFTDQLGITGTFVVATGTLTLTGPATLADFATALRTVQYRNTSDAPDPTLRAIAWIADDGETTNNQSVPVTSTITITAVNDAPGFTTGPDQTVNEDDGPQSVANWATGITDGDAGGTQTLTFNVTGNTDTSLFSAGPAVSATGTLTYTPATNANGTATITLTLSDDGGTANGGVDTSAPQTFTITVTAVNDPPGFTASDPPAVDEDAVAQSIPNWATFSPGPANENTQTVVGYTVSNVSPPGLFSTLPAVANNGTLTYTPAANVSGTATFDVVVQDNGGTANGGTDTSAVQTFTITVNAINDAPVLTAGGTLAYTENDLATDIDATITVIDVDSATLTGATVQITGNYQNGEDVLSFVDTATITGAFTPATGLLTLTGADTVTNYQTALRSVRYRNTSESPATAARTITWIATDGTTLSLAGTGTITVTAENDAPVLNASGAPSLPTIDQDAFTNTGVLVSVLLATGAGGNPITDPDAGALEGIAVIAMDNTNGDWQYDPVGGTAWVDFGDALADTNATLLAATARVRFMPNGTFNGDIPSGLTFRAWDQTSGASGATGVDVSVNGGSTAFSTTTETASITVDPVPQNVTYDAVGNTELVVEGGADGNGAVGPAFTTAPDGVLATTPTLTVVDGTFATTAGGSVTIDAQGRFNYTPQAGDTGIADSFTYTVGSGRTATVTINLAELVWYVQNNVSGAGTGTSTDPFQALQSAETASAAGDTIFVFLGDGSTDNQNTGIVLKANQRLLGHQDTSFTVGTATVETPSPGAQPALGNTTGPGVTVTNVTGVEIAGLDITGLNHGIAVSAAGALTIEIRDNTLTGGTGDGVNVVTSGAGAAVALSLHDNVLAATAVAGAGARLNGSAGGTLTITNFANNSVDGATTAGTGIIVTSAIFDATPGGTLNPVNAGTMAIGTATDRVGAAGMLLTTVSGDLVFGTLDIFSTNTGLQATGTGAFTGAAGFRLTTASGTTINAESGSGLDLSTLSLTNTLQGSVTSTNSPTTGISLSNVDGTITLTSSTITNPTGTAFNLSGGTMDVTYGGNITKNSTGLLVSVANHTTGTVTFQSGTLTATNGNGIQLNNSDGTVRFNDTTTLNGGNARVTIENGSAGTITFADATITNPSGTAFSVEGGTANITYSGSITKASAGLLASVTNGYAGTLTFQTGTLNATAGNGIELDNADGTVQFNGTTTLNGGNARVAIQNGSGGTFTFTSATITNPSGTAFSVDGGTAAVTYNGNMTKSSAGSLVSVTGGHATGTLRFQGGTLSATNGDGILLDNADGTVQFASTTTLNGGGARVTIQNGSAGTITFGNATITNPTGVAFSVSGGSSTVTYNGSITDTSDLAVSVASTTGGGVTLQGGTVTSSAEGIAISGTGGTVTIADADLSGGATVSITNNTAAVTFNDLQIVHSTGAANAININGGAGNVTITVNAANGIQSTVNRLVNITGRTGGTVAFGGGTLQGTGTSTGISVSGATAANTVQFNGAVDLGLSSNRLTGGTALTVNNNGQAGAVVSFANLDVFTSGSIGIDASNSGTLNVTTGQINTLSSNATGVQLNGLTAGMTFSSITVNSIGGTNEGLDFDNVSGSFTVTGATTIGTVGSVGVGIDINGGAAAYAFGTTTIGANRAGTGISIVGTSGTLQFGATTTSGAGGGTPGINVANTTGGSVTFASTAINNAGGAGAGLALTNNVATVTSNGGTIENSAGVEVDIDQGAAAITITSAITNTAGRAVEVTGRTGGTVTLSGTISDTNGTGILVQDNTVGGGSTTFSGASKVLNTGANTAVTLTNNPGHTINFTNGGLDIATTTAVGFNASGGGTINASGTGNTITTTGTTVIIANGVTFGATFDSVSSSGGVNNISLTALAGTLTMNGGSLSGSTAGAGNHAFLVSGGIGAITYGGSVTKNNTGNLVNISGRTAGSVTLSGTLTGSGSNGISVANNTGGSTTFSGTPKTLNTATLTAVTLATNTGHTINFTNGGLDIDTTTATGFSATGGGTVTVTTGANANTISSGTGTALNVANTIIGVNGLTFESISSSGSANGIMLSATGAGSLTVTGDGGGTNNGSGGTIQNTTGAGVLLTNVGNVSLNYVNITNPGTDGIRATTLNNGLTVNRSNISDSSGTAPADKAIDIGDFVTGTPVSGTINITNSVIGPASGNSPHDSLAIGISGGTSTWNITSTTFQRTANSGISAEVRGSSNVTLNITSSTFSGVVNTVAARGIFVNNLDDSVLNTTIQTSTFTNNNIHIDLNQQNDTDPSGSHTFKVLNNTTMTGARSHAMNIFAATGGGGAFTGTVEGNTIGNAGVAGSGSEIGNGIRVNINGGSDATMRLHNNTIRQTPNGRGIEIIARNGTGGLDITVTNNNVNPQALSDPLAAILVQSNCLTICNTVRADIRNNTVPSGTDVTDLLSTYLELVESSTSTLELVDTTSPISGTCASELAATNTGSTGVLGGCALIAGPINTPPP